MPSPKKYKIDPAAIAGLIGLGLTWGLFFSLARAAGETGINPFSILAYVVVFEMVVFGIIGIYRGKLPNIFRPASIIFYMAAALLGYMIPAVLELYSAPVIGAGLLTMIVSMTPIVTAILAFLMKTDILTARKITGIGLASLAMMPILLSNEIKIPIPEMATIGFVLAMLVPLCYGFYHNVIARYWPEGEDGWQLATGEMVVGSVVIVPAVWMINGLELAPVLDTGLYLIMIYSIILSAITIYLYFYLQQKGGPIFTSLAGFISLIAGVIFGMIFFGETYPWWIVASIATMILAIWLATGSGQKEE